MAKTISFDKLKELINHLHDESETVRRLGDIQELKESLEEDKKRLSEEVYKLEQRIEKIQRTQLEYCRVCQKKTHHSVIDDKTEVEETDEYDKVLSKEVFQRFRCCGCGKRFSRTIQFRATDLGFEEIQREESPAFEFFNKNEKFEEAINENDIKNYKKVISCLNSDSLIEAAVNLNKLIGSILKNSFDVPLNDSAIMAGETSELDFDSNGIVSDQLLRNFIEIKKYLKSVVDEKHSANKEKLTASLVFTENIVLGNFVCYRVFNQNF